MPPVAKRTGIEIGAGAGGEDVDMVGLRAGVGVQFLPTVRLPSCLDLYRVHVVVVVVSPQMKVIVIIGGQRVLIWIRQFFTIRFFPHLLGQNQ